MERRAVRLRRYPLHHQRSGNAPDARPGTPNSDRHGRVLAEQEADPAWGALGRDHALVTRYPWP